MRVGIKRHNLILNVLFYKSKRLARSGVICIEQWFLSINCLHQGVMMRTNDVLSDVVQKLVLILLEALLFVLLIVD